jgi:hypothetical protein
VPGCPSECSINPFLLKHVEVLCYLSKKSTYRGGTRMQNFAPNLEIKHISPVVLLSGVLEQIDIP